MIMPGLDLSHISSNWKKLQAQLESGDQDKQLSNGSLLKRKYYNHHESVASNYRKRARLGSARSSINIHHTQRMGGALSSAAATTTLNTQDYLSDLQNKFDIPETDVAGAYGGRGHGHGHQVGEDEINGGRHAIHKAGKYLALDCEMVGTGPPPHSDDLLARVSITNFHGQQIYDSYVLPLGNLPVKDYRTHVSGIREEHLRPGTARSFADVRKDVSDILQGNVLVGHALKKDLQALQIDHPKPDIRDTSKYPAFRLESRGKPPALRHLAKTHLGIVIQQGEHSSLEDARAAMMLYKKEKAGFETERRRTYGVVRPQRVAVVDGRLHATARGVTEREEYDSEDDEQLLQEDNGAGVNGERQGAVVTNTARRRKKKKKRTKR